jgi:hypothetical protein
VPTTLRKCPVDPPRRPGGAGSRGDAVFIIGAGTREDRKNGTIKEVRSIVDTIKIK